MKKTKVSICHNLFHWYIITLELFGKKYMKLYVYWEEKLVFLRYT